MNSHQPPTFALPFVDNPQRTLNTFKWLEVGLVLFLLLAGGWGLVINQVEADSLQKRNVASLSRSVIAVHSRPGEASHKIVLPASLRGNTETGYQLKPGHLSRYRATK
ncbi:MAG: hypothetical protein WCP96_18175 [Methylococcaceae bacterium]